jgi:hypothetical protein
VLGEPPKPLKTAPVGTSTRPRWVGLAARLMTDAGEPVLRVDDADHARLLRHMGARGLHEPLLACLPVDGHPTDESPAVAAAARALRALLPGNPKPVAALTRSPETVALLLRALDAAPGEREAARGALAAAVLFSLACSSALHEVVALEGPLTLQHTPTRRGIALLAGQTLSVGPGEFRLNHQPVDPWGSAFAEQLADHGGFAASRAQQARLPDPAALRAAHEQAHPRDGVARVARELFDALELDPAHSSAGADVGAPWTLPLAVGRARLPPLAAGRELARAWLREGVLHRLTLLRLVDPLVHDEGALAALLTRADQWACARVGYDSDGAQGSRAASTEPRAPEPCGGLSEEDLTPLGQRVLAELQVSR